MGLFDSKPAAAPLPLDVLTSEYLISGRVEPDNQKWVWAYFSPHEKRPAVALELTVTAARATGARPAPALVGASASFADAPSLGAGSARGDPTDALWEEWAAGGMGQPLAGELLVGPYAVSGTFLTVDGTMDVVINDRVAVRDAVFTRVDGTGDGAQIQAGRAVLATNVMHAAVVAGPLIQ